MPALPRRWHCRAVGTVDPIPSADYDNDMTRVGCWLLKALLAILVTLGPVPLRLTLQAREAAHPASQRVQRTLFLLPTRPMSLLFDRRENRSR